MQVVDSEGYLKVKLIGGPVGPFVPYTGATANVDLGEYEIKAGQVEFDQTPTGTAGIAVMRWNDQDGTADLGLKGGNVTLQIGQEQVTRVVNKTGVNLLEVNYQAVRISGAQGNRLKVDLAQANNDANSADTIGLVTETINDNQEGFVTASGIVRNIDTTGTLQGETWADGNVLYLSGTTAGRITNIKPAAPIHTVIMGYVVRAHATQGQIYVKVDNGYELDELHNVSITTPLNDQVLQYESATSLWKNKTISTGITIGSTAIASGVVGRVLFEGAGNVVQESANLFFDEVNNRFGIKTPIPLYTFDVTGMSRFNTNIATTNSILRLTDNNNGTAWMGYSSVVSVGFFMGANGAVTIGTGIGGDNTAPTGSQISIRPVTGGRMVFNTNSANDGLQFSDGANGTIRFNFPAFNETAITTLSTHNFSIGTASGTTGITSTTMKFFQSTGNVGIGTTTDAGFRLDVNGTARVQGLLTTPAGTNLAGWYLYANGTSLASIYGGSNWVYTVTSGGSHRFLGGNLLINTTTDAGFRLDVNGTARVQGVLTIGTELYLGNNNTGFFKSTNDFNFYNLANGSVKYRITGASQGFGISDNGYDTVAASAMLQVNSTTKGFLPPRMTTTQKNAIATPAAGLMVYDTTLNVISYYNGTMWI